MGSEMLPFFLLFVSDFKFQNRLNYNMFRRTKNIFNRDNRLEYRKVCENSLYLRCHKPSRK